MVQSSRRDAAKLGCILVALEEQLHKLDESGAGIAAIHVDAAIGQLRANIEALDEKAAMRIEDSMASIVAFG